MGDYIYIDQNGYGTAIQIDQNGTGAGIEIYQDWVIWRLNKKEW